MELSDEELRRKLQSLSICASVPITPTTRPILIRKLLASERSGDDGSASDERSREDSPPPSPPDAGEQTPVDEGCYMVYWSGGDQPVYMYYSKHSDAMQAVKEHRGARFRHFPSLESAKEFSPIEFQSSTGVGSEKPPNSFRPPTVPQFNQLRSAIEQGNMEEFSKAVWENPLYLVNIFGDTPTILHRGAQYNAIHCVVKYSEERLSVCKGLLSILEDESFYSRLYPNDGDQIKRDRRKHILDHYLNGRDHPMSDTPLHLACKLGYEDVVSLLLSKPLTDARARNREGHTPAQLVRSNLKLSEPTKKKILELLNEPEIYYVGTLRSLDNTTPPVLGRPLARKDLSLWTDTTPAEVAGSSWHGNSTGRDYPSFNQALAGPMSPSEANHFYDEWRSPKKLSERKDANVIKRSDPTRGMERVGRQLAQRKGVVWQEYWDFLNCYCDLSKPAGLRKLELYLSSHWETSSSSPPSTPPSIPPPSSPPPPSTPPSSLPPGSLVANSEVFGCPQSGKGEEGGERREEEEEGGEGEEVVAGLAEDFGRMGLEIRRAKQVKVGFVVGSTPTKMDYDVYLAVSQYEVDPDEFPHISKWLELIRQFPDNTKKGWRTPISTSLVQSRLNATPLSPLVLSNSSPPLSRGGGRGRGILCPGPAPPAPRARLF